MKRSSGEQTVAKGTANQKERYRLYSLEGMLPDLERHLVSIIGEEEGKVSYTYSDKLIKDMLCQFVYPAEDRVVKDTDPPEKYFAALEARFSTSSRMLLMRTGGKDK